MSPINKSYTHLPFFILLLPFLYLIYYPSFQGPFYLDSLSHLSVSQIDFIKEISKDSDQFLSRIGTRLLVSLTFCLNELLIDHSPNSFRMGNVLVHWGTCIAAFFFLKSLWQVFLGKEDSKAPIALTMIWSLHPLSTTAVSYVIQRSTSLSFLFIFWAFHIYLQTKHFLKLQRSDNKAPTPHYQIKQFVIIFILFIIACLCKETAILALPMLLVMEIILEKSIKKVLANRFIWFLFIAPIIMGLIIWYGHRHEINMILKNYSSLSTYVHFSWDQRLLTEARVVFLYFTKSLLPWGENYFLQRLIPLSQNIASPFTTLTSILFHFALILLATIKAKHKPLFSLGILCFYISQLMESTVLPLHIYFEHRVYGPHLFLLVALYDIVFQSNKLHKYASSARGQSILIVLLLYLAFQTYWRNTFYGNPIKLYENDIRLSSTNLAHCNLANEYYQIKDYENAKKHFQKAVDLREDHYGGFAGRGACELQLNEPLKAIQSFKLALQKGNENLQVYRDLGLAKMLLRKPASLETAWQDLLYYANSIFANKYENHLWVVAALISKAKTSSQAPFEIAIRNIDEAEKDKITIQTLLLRKILEIYAGKANQLQGLLDIQSIAINHPEYASFAGFTNHFRINPQENSIEFSNNLEAILTSYHSASPEQKTEIIKKLFEKLSPEEHIQVAYFITEFLIITQSQNIFSEEDRAKLNDFINGIINSTPIYIKNYKLKSPYLHMIISFTPPEIFSLY